MTQSFRAMLLEKTDDKQSLKATSLTEDDLMPGDVTIAVDYSTLNFKDGLAMTGASPVVRSFPMIPGIDLVGTVTQSDNPKFSVGDKVLQNGYGLS